MNKITLGEALKKHLRIIGYLAASAGLAYLLSVVSDKPEAVYLTPVINYVLYAIAKELEGEGVVTKTIQTLRK